MADFRIALGGTISAATTDEMHDALGGMESRLAANRAPLPVYKPVSAYINIGNMNQFDARILSIGSPSPGRVWRLTRLTVLGVNEHDVLTNVVAGVYIGDDQNPAMTQCVQDSRSIPFTTIENECAFIIHSRESLFLNVFASGANAAVSVTANAFVAEYTDGSFEAQSM